MDNFSDAAGIDPDKQAQGLLTKLDREPVWQINAEDGFVALNPEFQLVFQEGQKGCTPAQAAFLEEVLWMCPDLAFSTQDCCVERTEAILYFMIEELGVPIDLVSRWFLQTTHFNQFGIEDCYERPYELQYRKNECHKSWLTALNDPRYPYITLERVHSLIPRLNAEKTRGILSPYLNIAIDALLREGMDPTAKINDDNVREKIIEKLREFYDDEHPLRFEYQGTTFQALAYGVWYVEGQKGQSEYILEDRSLRHVGHAIPAVTCVDEKQKQYQKYWDIALDINADDNKARLLKRDDFIAGLSGRIGKPLRLMTDKLHMSPPLKKEWEDIRNRLKGKAQSEKLAEFFNIHGLGMNIVFPVDYRKAVEAYESGNQRSKDFLFLTVGSFARDCIKEGLNYFEYQERFNKRWEKNRGYVARMHPAFWLSGACDSDHRKIPGWHDFQSPDNKVDSRDRYTIHALKMALFKKHEQAIVDPDRPLGFYPLMERICTTLKPDYRKVSQTAKPVSQEALRGHLLDLAAAVPYDVPDPNISKDVPVFQPFSFFNPQYPETESFPGEADENLFRTPINHGLPQRHSMPFVY